MSDLSVAWLGHATTDIRIAGARFLTDPLLRDRLVHLRRHAGTSVLPPGPPVTAVLVSHLHHDHLDLPSLRRLAIGTPLVVPRGARVLLRGVAADVLEVGVGDEVDLGGVRVTAVPAAHQRNRAFTRVTAAPLGFLLEGGGRTAYFPGDTDLHPVMGDLPAPDVALLPIWGWGPTIGPGHLDPTRAAEAAVLLRARSVLPVHWGTLAPIHNTAVGSARSAVRRTRVDRTGDRPAPAWLRMAGTQFAASMARHAPDVDLRLVDPGPALVPFAAP